MRFILFLSIALLFACHSFSNSSSKVTKTPEENVSFEHYLDSVTNAINWGDDFTEYGSHGALIDSLNNLAEPVTGVFTLKSGFCEIEDCGLYFLDEKGATIPFEYTSDFLEWEDGFEDEVFISAEYVNKKYQVVYTSQIIADDPCACYRVGRVISDMQEIK